MCDNSGLGSILAEYLASGSDHGQILVLVMNKLGDHQMETYFEYSAGEGGQFCWDETMGTESDDEYQEMTLIHKKAMAAVGGKYIPAKHEPPVNDKFPGDHNRPCAIRLARHAFFKVRSTYSRQV